MRILALMVCLAAVAAAAEPNGLTTGSDMARDGRRRQFEQLANAHRARIGCGRLRWDPAAAAVAQQHADDMVRRDFFSHTNPDGKSPFDRLRAAGVTYTAAAENIAFGYVTASAVLDAWVASKGHRRNLENCRYTHHGVGLRDRTWVQVFIRR